MQLKFIVLIVFSSLLVAANIVVFFTSSHLGLPTYAPTLAPTATPTTKSPTAYPTTGHPTKDPTLYPTDFPTLDPTSVPTTGHPTTLNPTMDPTTAMPTPEPSQSPSRSPTVSTHSPTKNPTTSPTYSPSPPPTFSPTAQPTALFHLWGNEILLIDSYLNYGPLNKTVVKLCGHPDWVFTDICVNYDRTNAVCDILPETVGNVWLGNYKHYYFHSTFHHEIHFSSHTNFQQYSGNYRKIQTLRFQLNGVQYPQTAFPYSYNVYTDIYNQDEPICSTQPTNNPTFRPSQTPSVAPTEVPTHDPTLHPTEFPTLEPTMYPTTEYPTSTPTTAVPTVYSMCSWNTTKNVDISTDNDLDKISYGGLHACLEVCCLYHLPCYSVSHYHNRNRCRLHLSETITQVINDPEYNSVTSYVTGASPTFSPTRFPTRSPTEPTHDPTPSPTHLPSVSPTRSPTDYPTGIPTISNVVPMNTHTWFLNEDPGETVAVDSMGAMNGNVSLDYTTIVTFHSGYATFSTTENNAWYYKIILPTFDPFQPANMLSVSLWLNMDVTYHHSYQFGSRTQLFAFRPATVTDGSDTAGIKVGIEEIASTVVNVKGGGCDSTFDKQCIGDVKTKWYEYPSCVGSWCHIVYSFASNTMYIFHNGQIKIIQPNYMVYDPNNVVTWSGNVIGGGLSDSLPYHMSDIRLYNGNILSESDISTLYHNGIPTHQPTMQPTSMPTDSPSFVPSASPTNPTNAPTVRPSASPTAAPTTGPATLLHRWKLNEAVGSSTCVDSVGSLEATVDGPAVFNSDYVTFDSAIGPYTSSKLTFPSMDPFGNSNTMSFSMWINLASGSTSGHYYNYVNVVDVSKTRLFTCLDNTYLSTAIYGFAIGNFNIASSFYYNIDREIRLYENSVCIQQWCHVVMTFTSKTSTEVKVWINNNYFTGVSGINMIANGSPSLFDHCHIGNQVNNGWSTYSMSDVRLYNGNILNGIQISALYLAGRNPT